LGGEHIGRLQVEKKLLAFSLSLVPEADEAFRIEGDDDVLRRAVLTER
jgi:hypothetical protein